MLKNRTFLTRKQTFRILNWKTQDLWTPVFNSYILWFIWKQDHICFIWYIHFCLWFLVTHKLWEWPLSCSCILYTSLLEMNFIVCQVTVFFKYVPLLIKIEIKYVESTIFFHFHLALIFYCRYSGSSWKE